MTELVKYMVEVIAVGGNVSMMMVAAVMMRHHTAITKLETKLELILTHLVKGN